MRKELQEKLVKKFPKMFKYQTEKTRPITPMAFGCECISSGSRILMHDLSTKNIEDIKIGDVVVGFIKTKTRWRLHKSVVYRKIYNGKKECLRINNGNSEIIATKDHPFLCKLYSDYYGWKEAGLLSNDNYHPVFLGDHKNKNSKEYKLGWLIGVIQGDGHVSKHNNNTYSGFCSTDEDVVSRFINYCNDLDIHISSCKTEYRIDCGQNNIYRINIWQNQSAIFIKENISSKEFSTGFKKGWVAGFIDAEGSVYNDYIKQHRLMIYQKENKHLDRLYLFLNDLDIKYTYNKRKNIIKGAWVEIVGVNIPEPFKLINMCTPVLSRKNSVWVGSSINNYGTKCNVEKYGECDVYDLSTSTGSFVANGFAVHNCGDGWFRLIYDTCLKLQWDTDHNNHGGEFPQIVFTQIKEKFGTLRLYVAGASDYQYGIIDMAESVSGWICEYCGTTKDVGNTQGWVRTICRECLNEHYPQEVGDWEPLKMGDE